MRLLLIADVHANWDALLALQRAEPQPDAVLFAGDAVGFGPEPPACLRWLRAQAVLAVRGECDEMLISGGWQAGQCGGGLEEAAQQTIELARRQLSPADRATLALWPPVTSIHLGGANFLLAHAAPARPLGGGLDLLSASEAELAAALAGRRADFVVVGYTHVPALRRSADGTLFINPGSLGQPRYGRPDATYAIWDDGQVQVKHLHYDRTALLNKLRLAPLSAEAVAALAGVLETGLAPEVALM